MRAGVTMSIKNEVYKKLLSNKREDIVFADIISAMNNSGQGKKDKLVEWIIAGSNHTEIGRALENAVISVIEAEADTESTTIAADNDMTIGELKTALEL
jgi:predicted CopG family antitoxin